MFGTASYEIVGMPRRADSAVIVPPDPIKISVLYKSNLLSTTVDSILIFFWKICFFYLVKVNKWEVKNTIMENIIKPIALDKILSELTPARFVRNTNNSDNELYIVNIYFFV